MALINTTTTGVLGTTLYGDGSGNLTVQKDGVTQGIYGSIPAFSGYLSGNQTLSSTVYQKLSINTMEYNIGNFYDATTNYRFTPNIAGYYQFNAALTVTAQQVILLSFYKNNASFKRVAYSYNSPVFVASGSALIYLNGTTDYVEVIGRSETGGTAYGGGAETTWFQGYLVKAA
jgi:hypothetical protein